MRAQYLALSLVAIVGCATTQAPHKRTCQSPTGWGEGVEAARAYLAACAAEEVVPLLQGMIKHQTVGAETPASEGPAFRAMAADLKRFAESNDLRFRSFAENAAWEVGTGVGKRTLALITHADVVPVRATDAAHKAPLAANEIPRGWEYPPFSGQRVGNRVYGRGAEDNKGSIASVLIALRTLKWFGIETRGEVVSISGTGEESNWKPMRAYVQASPQPVHAISLDASYPVVIGESGFVAWTLSGVEDISTGELPRIAQAKAGNFLTQIPGQAEILVAPAEDQSLEALSRRLKKALKKALKHLGPEYTGTVEKQTSTVRVALAGKSAHSSDASSGHNALWGLATLAQHMNFSPTISKSFLDVIYTFFVDDHNGRKLGLSYSHPVMGPLLVAPTVFRYDGQKATLRINLRRPAGIDSQSFGKMLDKAVLVLQQSEPAIQEAKSQRYVGEPILVDADRKIVKQLTKIYRKHTGDHTTKPKSITGGTYARLFRGAVSFGPSMPGKPYLGHTANEYVEVDTLLKSTQMIFDAIIELATSEGDE